VHKNMQRGMCKLVRKLVFFPWHGVVEANETVMQRFLRLFPTPSRIRCSDFAKS